MWRALANIMDKSFHCGSVEGLKQKLRTQLLNCVPVKAWFVVLFRRSHFPLIIPIQDCLLWYKAFQVTDPFCTTCPDSSVPGVNVRVAAACSWIISLEDGIRSHATGLESVSYSTLVVLFLFKMFCNNTKERKTGNIKGQVSRSWHLRDYVIA